MTQAKPSQPSKRSNERVWNFFTIFLLIFFAVIMITPFIWLLSSSFKTQNQIFQYPPQWIPDPFQPENYVKALTYKPFHLYLKNMEIGLVLY